MTIYSAAVDVGTAYHDPDAYPRVKTTLRSGTSPDLTLTTLSAAIATAVADGASPTQAHVTAINNAFTPVNAAAAHDLTINWNSANIASWSQFEQAVRAALQVARGSGKLTGS